MSYGGSRIGSGRKSKSAYAKDMTNNGDITANELRKQAEDALNENLTADLLPPKDFNVECKKIWKKTVGDINNSGLKILTDADIPTLRIYCINIDLHNRSVKQYDDLTGGIMVASADKDVQREIDGIIKVMKKAESTITQTANVLGLTPSSRASIAIAQAKNKEKNSDITKFMEMGINKN